jgi:hypothetical protein
LAPLVDDFEKLVVRQGIPETRSGLLISLDGARLRVDGNAVPVDQLTAELSRKREIQYLLDPAQTKLVPMRVLFAVTRDTAWQQVVSSVYCVAAAGFDSVAFVFANPRAATPRPGPSSVDADVDALIRGLRNGSGVARWRMLLSRVTEACPGVRDAYAPVAADVDFEEIAERVVAAVSACECHIDIAALKTLHWASFGNRRPLTSVTLRLASAQANQGTTVSAPPDRAWEQAYSQLVALRGRGPVQLLVDEQLPTR